MRKLLRELVEWIRRVCATKQTVEGYRQQPQTEQELGWTDEVTQAMIAEEPW